MVAFVVDNSVVVAWLYPGQATAYTERLLEISGEGTLLVTPRDNLVSATQAQPIDSDWLGSGWAW